MRALPSQVCSHDTVLTRVEHVSSQARCISLLFHASMDSSQWQIKRIYEVHRAMATKEYGAMQSAHPHWPERLLWHGYSRAPLAELLHTGLDTAHARDTGNVLGAAIYLSVSAHYSHRYTVRSASGRYRLL